MSANTRANTDALIRSELWQRQLEETLHEQLMPTESFCRQIDFPDGSAMTMVSMGTPTVRTLPEDVEITFDALDTAEKQMTLSNPIYSANSISELTLEDSLWGNDFLTRVPLEQGIAIAERFQTEVFALANSQSAGTGNANNINGVAHRRIARGTNETMSPQDFAFVGYSLTKAKVPHRNLIAIVDPSVAYALETSTNLVNLSNNPQWTGIIETGLSNNMRFIRNVYGFDVYESNLLATANETIGGLTTAAGKANIFLSAGNEMLLPFMVAWKRRPKIERQFNMLTREEQIFTTARWGTKLTREDNLVVVLSDTDQV
jgi:hypothetical protein